jgi:hypothetical protein
MAKSRQPTDNASATDVAGGQSAMAMQESIDPDSEAKMR